MSELLLGRYEIIDEAGSGGFAHVYVAWDTRIQRKVAIKCMPLGSVLVGQNGRSLGSIMIGENTFDPNIIPGLEEARMAAMLNDSHIVSVYDFEIQNDEAFLILEYIEGITLGDLLKDYADEITPDIIAAVFQAVSRALQVAHKNHVLHLDIKPDNVLIDFEGNVKVVDFGLARLAGENGFGAATGGTIGYMPPEQMRQEDLDERCDEWALASLTYEMIMRENPFIASTLEKSEGKIYDAELVVPSVVLRDADESVDDILFCALDPDRDCRYDSVADFSREMKQCLGSSKKGTKQLAQLMSASLEDADEEELQAEGEYAPYELPSRAREVVLRGWSVLSVAVIACVAITNLPIEGAWTNPASWVALLVVLVLGAVIPHVGAAIALSGFGVALILHNASAWGVLFIVVTWVWWFTTARLSTEHTNVSLSSILFGSVGLAALAPLCIGSFLRVRDALFSVLFSGLFAFFFAGLGSGSLINWNIFLFREIHMWTDVNSTLLALVQSSQFWLLFISWVLSALVVSLCSARLSRAFMFVGVVVALAFMVAALVGDVALRSGGQILMPDVWDLALLAAAGVLMLVFDGLFLEKLKAPFETEPFETEQD